MCKSNAVKKFYTSVDLLTTVLLTNFHTAHCGPHWMLYVTTLLVPKTTTAPEMVIVVVLQFWVKMILHWIVGLYMKTVSTRLCLDK
jgi:hypothetical protein